MRKGSRSSEAISESGLAIQEIESLKLFAGTCGEVKRIRPRSEHLAIIQYTFGSTSEPKGVMVSHGNLMCNQESICSAFGESGFSDTVFFPCNGLAEATLFVAGGPARKAPTELELDKLEYERNLAEVRGIDNEAYMEVVSYGKTWRNDVVVVMLLPWRKSRKWSASESGLLKPRRSW